MSSLRAVLYRLWSVFSKPRSDEVLDEEIRSHLGMLAEENVRRGMTPDQAQREARLALGGLEQTKEACRDQRGIPLIEAAVRDLRYAVRLMRRNPGFTVTALLTLILGIGANTTIFSIVDAVLFRPLPYPEPERIVKIATDWRNPPEFAFLLVDISHALREKSSTIASIAHYVPQDFSMGVAGDSEKIAGAYVSPSLFGVLGVNAMRGRLFYDGEIQKGKECPVLLGYDLWRRRFAEDQSVLGKSITLNGASYIVVGIMPPGFSFPEGQAALWIPDQVLLWQGMAGMPALARLRAGATAKQAEAEVTSIVRALYPRGGKPGQEMAFVVPWHEELTREAKPALIVLFVAVVVVLAIACVNLGDLMAARSRGRVKEFGIRTALGATRWTIVRQAITESLLLSAMGGALGCLGSYWAVDLFRNFSPMKLRSEYAIGIDARVLFFTMGISILTGTLMGLWGVWEASKADVLAVLGNARQALKSRLRFRLGSGSLVAFQVAFGLTMLVAGGLLMRSFIALISVDPGYVSDRVLTATLRLPRGWYMKRPVESEAFYRQLRESLTKLPEVEAVALTSYGGIPLTGYPHGRTFYPQGWPKNSDLPIADLAEVSPEYTKVMRLHLLHGRFFSELDTAQAPRVVVISESLARLFFPGLNPIGMTIGSGTKEDPVCSIVGVVADVKFYGLALETRPCIYYPIIQRGQFSMLGANLLIRTRVRPEEVIPILRTRIASTDRSVTPGEIRTMDDRLWDSVAQPRFYTVLMGCFALSAVMLVLLGIYGNVAYMVSGRTREIGLRIALGAQRGSIYRLIIGQCMMPGLIGITAGLALAWALTRFLSSLLFGIQPHDPATFVALPVFLAATILLASYIPARRAARLDPMAALKEE